MPVETRVWSSSIAPNTGSTFSLSSAPGASSAESMVAQKLAVKAMRDAGWQQSDTPAYTLVVSTAARPAAIAITERSALSAPVRALASSKKPKPLQSCQDTEHRLAVSLMRISDGAILYNASAAEYHCKAKLADTLAMLSASVWADFGSGTSQTRTVQRTTLE